MQQGQQLPLLLPGQQVQLAPQVWLLLQNLLLLAHGVKGGDKRLRWSQHELRGAAAGRTALPLRQWPPLPAEVGDVMDGRQATGASSLLPYLLLLLLLPLQPLVVLPLQPLLVVLLLWQRLRFRCCRCCCCCHC